MKNLSSTLLVLGLVVLAYAVFSNFYGKLGVALMCINSKTLLTVANSLLLLSLIVSVKELSKKS